MQKYPGIRIVDERTGAFNVAQAQQAAEDVLNLHPELGGILALNSAATYGAYFALKNRRLLGRVKLVACEQDLIPPLYSGDIDSVIVENTYEMGYRAVEAIAAERRGQPVPGITKLSPKLVDRTNIDTPEVRHLLTMNWSGAR